MYKKITITRLADGWTVDYNHYYQKTRVFKDLDELLEYLRLELKLHN